MLLFVRNHLIFHYELFLTWPCPHTRTNTNQMHLSKSRHVWAWLGILGNAKPKVIVSVAILLQEKKFMQKNLRYQLILSRDIDTGKNTIISPAFLVWKFCGKAQFSHTCIHVISGDSLPFRKISTPRNQVKLRYFSQCDDQIFLQSDWMRAFWPKTCETELFQIQGFKRKIKNLKKKRLNFPKTLKKPLGKTQNFSKKGMVIFEPLPLC